MRELSEGLAPWDWSNAEFVVFGDAGQEIGTKVDRGGQRHITTELQAMYDDLVHQPLPERLLELMAKLN